MQVYWSFNEAPIHESGKFVLADAVGVAATRFNEAPIHESGKSGIAGEDHQGILASMRPRFMNRGSTGASGACTRVDSSLQ